MRIAVAGGTGLVGGMTVRALERAGHDPVVISRLTGANTITGDGLDEALQGVEAVVDESNTNELEVAEAGPVPVTILRAAQFFEFAELVMGWMRDGDTVTLPPLLLQPVAAADG